MKLSTPTFRGMAPRITPRALPENAAQSAINARLLTGDLEAWKRPALIESLAHAGVVRSIFLLDDTWLSYEQEVEFARGTILGDTTFRTYITGLDAPRFTNYELATQSGGPPYPVETRLLGVPGPDGIPTVTVSVTAPDETAVSLTNAGAETGNTVGWTIDGGGLVSIQDGDIPPLVAHSGTHFFGGGASATTEAYQSVDIGSLGIIAGQGLTLSWWQAAGADGSTAGMGLAFYDGATFLADVPATEETVGTPNTWVQRTLSAQVPDGADTVRLIQQYTLVGTGDIDAYIDTITLNAIAYTNSFDGSSLSGWTVSPNQGTTGNDDKHRNVRIDATMGRPQPSIFVECDERVPYFHRDFSTDTSPQVVLQFDYYEDRDRSNSGLHALLFAGDSGNGTSIFFSSWAGVRVYSHADWETIGGNLEDLAPSLPHDVWYTVTLTATPKSSSEADVIVRVVNAATNAVVVNDVAAVIPIDGPRIGFKASPPNLHNTWYIDNISVTMAPPNTNADGDVVYTSYVFTYVNDFGEESAPSDPSETIQRNDNAVTTIVTPTTLPTGVGSDYGITYKRIYRAVTGSLGSEFRFVAEIPLGQSTYVDTLTDAELGEVLESDGWDLPPDDLRYILALPNGIMVGASGNQLCFSAQNHPHAWPIAYRLATDSRITGLGNVDTSVVVGTQTFVYTASGNSPDAYSMSKPGAPHSCVSARSLAYLLRIGVVFAGPDGLMAVNGPTEVVNLTETIFTREQWQALQPETITGLAHDDVYFFFYGDTTGPRGGYALDMKPNGFGLIEVGMHASALAADLERDAMAMVLTEYAEPDGNLLSAETGSEVPADGVTLYEWNAAQDAMRYSWNGKLWLNPHPQAFQWVRVRAEDYDDLEIRFTADGATLLDKLVTSGRAFRLPVRADYNEIHWTAIGTSRVRSVELADDVMELA
jgi:hypothetical protein